MKDELEQLGEALEKGEDVVVEAGGTVRPTHPEHPAHPVHPIHPVHPENKVKPPRSFGGAFPQQDEKLEPWNLCHPEIYEMDLEAMSRWFPQFERIMEGARLDGWLGKVKPLHSSLEAFILIVVYPPNFPPAMPRIKVLMPDIFKNHPGHPHFYMDGSICCFFPPDRSWIAGQNNVAELIQFACIWLVGHLFWKKSGKWPIPSVDQHDDAYIRKIVKGNDPCVCGSGRKFKKCHGRIL